MTLTTTPSYPCIRPLFPASYSTAPPMRHVARGLLPAVWGEDQFLRVLAIAEKTCHRRPIMRVIAQSLTHASLHCPPSSHRTLHMPIIIIPPPFLRPVDHRHAHNLSAPLRLTSVRALCPPPALFVPLPPSPSSALESELRDELEMSVSQVHEADP